MGTQQDAASPTSGTEQFEGYQYIVNGRTREILDLSRDELLLCLKHAIDVIEKVDEAHDTLGTIIRDFRKGE